MRRALAAVVLLSSPLAALAAPAQAAETAEVTQLPASVHLSDPPGTADDRVSVTASYRCTDATVPGDWYVTGDLTRPDGEMTEFHIGTRYYGFVRASCTGEEVTQTLLFRRHGMDTFPSRYLAGEADLTVSLFFAETGSPEPSGSLWVGSSAKTNVVLPAPTPAPKKPVALTTNATPEPVRVGSTLTVKGTLERDGKAYRAGTSLQFRTPTGSYRTVKSVTSSSAGNLSTTVTADRDGCFRYSFAGNATTSAGVSAGDCVDVIPKPEDYANCTELRTVYPHGVGRNGAVDQGGDVNTFTRDNATYDLNTESDRDKDKIACER